MAIKAAERSLFSNVFADEDREDVATQVVEEFVKHLLRGKLPQCTSEDDVVSWIWGRTTWRAINLRRKRKRENTLFDRQPCQDDQCVTGEGAGIPAGELPVRHEPITDEARVDELIAWARLMPAGFSRAEEAAYRAVVLRGSTTEEYAVEIGRPPGTVGRYVWEAKRKIAAVLEQERQSLQ